jgi:hypothetical protein
MVTPRSLLRLAASAIALALVVTSTSARAQRRRPAQQPSEPKQGADEEEERGALLRTQPAIEPPADPLVISPQTRSQIGTDWMGGAPSPDGPLVLKRAVPYEERRGDYQSNLLPPLWIEHTRGLPDRSQSLYGVPDTPDKEGLYGLLYYRRRSLHLDMDVVFPAFWRVRDGESHVVVAGPVVHREAPGENDNWVAPLFFEGHRPDGGYFHSPVLLTTSHWSTAGAFTLVGPYFRDRSGTDVDAGVVPFYFHGDTGGLTGNRRTYTIIPPLLYYHNDRELEGTSTTIVGPVIAQSSPKREVLDVAPLFFHIGGRPETGGVPEDHTTLLPFFHYGHDPEGSLFIVPGYLRRVTRTADTLLTPFFSQAETRKGATTLTAVGPVVPLWWNYRDRDLGVHAWALAPLFYTSDSPAGHDWLTPLLGRFETYGQYRTWWLFPTLTLSTDRHGWENDLHPIFYVGRNDDSTHTVVAPVFWDFANPSGRTTIAFPVYWRFADGQDASVTQVAANTLYIQKRVAGGTDWQFHLLPLVSYGENPNGYFWNLLFGLAGYTRNGAQGTIRAFWIPIHVGGAPPPAQAAWVR